MDIKEIMLRCEPVWRAETVYAESVTFVKDDDGSAFAPLLYKPGKIIKVTDAREERVYVEGRDYVMAETGVVRLPESDMFAFDISELEPEDPVPGQYFPAEDRNIFFTEGHFFHDRQISVTYEPAVNDWDGPVPTSALDILPHAKKCLTEDKKLRLLVYGDSISVGANASGFADSYAPPYQPNYANMLAAVLGEKYGAEIIMHNPSVGGVNSAWGVENADELAIPFKPDLAIVAFGGNDSPTDPETYGANINKIADMIKENVPDCDFIFAATMLPNKLLSSDKARFYGNQPLFVPVLKTLAKERGNAAVASISEMHDYLLTRKRFIDMTGNNVNHPNDFMHRVHAQYYLELLS
ncbi:MAG: SGNH/GDSL hydrolase family protein [Clostridia bacterium]|nr:SGNH/GDSL hydrolase family protein [Clostridia bacterium]